MFKINICNLVAEHDQTNRRADDIGLVPRTTQELDSERRTLAKEGTE